MINYKTINKNENVMVCYSEFTPPKGVTEYQVMIQLTKPGQSYEEQLKLLLDTYSDLKENEFKKGTTIFKRYFLSDAANQTDLLLAAETEHSDCALSIIEQAPCNGTKIALWAFLQTRTLRGGTQRLSSPLERKRFQPCLYFGIPDAAVAE